MIVYRLTKCEGGQVSPSILDHTCSLHLARRNNVLSSTQLGQKLTSTCRAWMSVKGNSGTRRVSLNHFERAAAHSSRESRAGHIALPHFVRLYSTFGGTCG